METTTPLLSGGKDARPRARTPILGILLAAAMLAPVWAASSAVAHTIEPDQFAYQHETLFLDAQAVRTQALTLGQFNLQAFGKNYTFALSPVNDLTPGTTTFTTVDDTTGQVITLPLIPIVVFKGTATADRNTTATLTLPGNWIEGEIRDGSDIIYLEPKNSLGGTGLVETVVYRYSDLRPIPAGNGPEGDDTMPGVVANATATNSTAPASPQSSQSSPSSGSSGSGSTTSKSTSSSSAAKTGGTAKTGGGGGGGGSTCAYPRMDIVTDRAYSSAYGSSSWPNQVRSVFSLVNNVWSTFCVTFQMTTMEWDGSLVSMSFNQAWSDFTSRHPHQNGIDFAAYLSGLEFSGCNMGNGEQPGYYTMEEQRTDNDCHSWFGSALSEQAYVVKHEIGHNHSATHDQSDTWWDNGNFHRTIMYGSIVGWIHDYYSYGGRCSCQNNDHMIRQWVQWQHK